MPRPGIKFLARAVTVCRLSADSLWSRAKKNRAEAARLCTVWLGRTGAQPWESRWPRLFRVFAGEPELTDVLVNLVRDVLLAVDGDGQQLVAGDGWVRTGVVVAPGVALLFVAQVRRTWTGAFPFRIER